jgi:hypothetical protein
MRGRAAVAVVVTALGLVAAVTPADGTEHQVNPATGVALSPCFSDDHGLPVVRSIRLSRSTVDVTERAQRVEVIVDVVDTGGPGTASGVSSVTLYEGLEPMRRATDGTWRTTLRAPQGSSPGSTYLYAVATDRVGNSSPGPGPHGYTPEPHAVLQVVSAAAPDEHAPGLRRVRLSRTTVDALSDRRTVDVSVAARDRESGVFSVSGWLVRDGDDGRTHEVRLRLVSGDSHRGRWAGRVVVPLWAHGGRWRPAFFARDRFGHGRALLGVSDDAGALVPRLRVRSGPDSAPPVLRSVSVAPTRVDVRAGSHTVVVDVRARDHQSGVAAVELEVDGTQVTDLPARLVDGTRRDGTWRVALKVSTCAVAGDWIVRVVGITDRRGRRYDGYSHPYTSGRTLTVVNTDRVVPDIASQTVGSGSVEVEFTEDVVGVGPASAQLTYSQYGFFDFPGTPLAGGWQCRDAQGAASSCLTGPVRTAVFVPEAPLPSTGAFLAVLNPEHILDVTDLAGNPAGTARRLVSRPR